MTANYTNAEKLEALELGFEAARVCLDEKLQIDTMLEMQYFPVIAMEITATIGHQVRIIAILQSMLDELKDG